MIWESLGMMTLLDLVILGSTAVALRILIQRSAGPGAAGSKVGPWMIGLGLLGIGLFYLTDLIIMWVAPALTTPDRAQLAMEALHLEYNWIVTLLAVAMVVLGLRRTMQGLSNQSATLRKSAERYRSLYEKTPFMLHSLDLQGHIVRVSDTWLETLGYEREEVVGRPAREFVTPESWEYTEDICLPKFRETGVLEDVQMEFLRKDGQTVEVLLSALAERDSNGEIVRSLSASKDVTELSRAKKRLEELSRRNELILESAGEGIYGLDSNGNVTFINQAAATMIGWSPGELMGKSMHGVLHHTRENGESYPAEECPIYAAFMDGEVHQVANEVFWRKDGSSFPVEFTSTPIREDGSLLGAVVVFRDVTESRRIQTILRDSEEQYRGVFEATADGLTIHELENAALIAANPAMARMHGYELDEFVRLSPEDYVPAESLFLLQEMLETVRNGDKYHFAAQALRKDGTLIDVEGHAVPLRYKGKMQALGIARDVTKQRNAERESQRAMEEIAQLRDELEQERDYLREEVTAGQNFGEIIGESKALKRVLAQIEAVATTSANVLVLGETGVGKELIARAVHNHSPRSSGPLVKVNCASIPRDLFESEFFGHVKGAFTGAHRDRIGRFQLAHHGTLFLDEVGETPLELQGKLLRVLEEGEFERVGEAVTRNVDVRLIAATNRDLKREVEADRFREDLYFRLSVFPLEVPPLRERREDILPLATHFLNLACREFGCHDLALSRFQAEVLRQYDWPGNVRELRSVLERAVILSPGSRLRLDLAVPGLLHESEKTSSEKTSSKAEFLTASELKLFEHDNLIAVLEHADWRVAGENGAARLLGMKPSTVRYQMKALGISRPR